MVIISYIPLSNNSRERDRNRWNWAIWIFKLKESEAGRVLEPAIAKLTPFVKFLPIDSINGVK